uniref:Uncharacterized protein n=1 Tax=Vitis vinifera TaxID=29760 RepID=F6HFS3_VITVI
MRREAHRERELRLLALRPFQSGAAAGAQAPDCLRLRGARQRHHALRQRPVQVATGGVPGRPRRDPAVALAQRLVEPLAAGKLDSVGRWRHWWVLRRHGDDQNA